MSLLSVQHLTVHIDEKLVIDDVGFDLGPGERLSILGPNGAGKTVLLKALLNLLPYKGTVAWAPHARIGYVPQKIEAETHLPLTFNDLFRAKSHTLNITTRDVDEVASTIGLTRKIRETPVGHLSGGQFQRARTG